MKHNSVTSSTYMFAYKALEAIPDCMILLTDPTRLTCHGPKCRSRGLLGRGSRASRRSGLVVVDGDGLAFWDGRSRMARTVPERNDGSCVGQSLRCERYMPTWRDSPDIQRPLIIACGGGSHSIALFRLATGEAMRACRHPNRWQRQQDSACD